MCSCEFLTCGRGVAGSDPGWCCRRWRLELGWHCIRPPPPLLFLLSETVAAVVGLPWFPKAWKPWQHTHTHYLFFPSNTHKCLSGGVHSKGFHFSRDQMVFGTSRTVFSGWPTVRLRYWDREPACFLSITIQHLRKKGTRYKIKGDVSGDSSILSKPTIRRAVAGGLSHSPVC